MWGNKFYNLEGRMQLLWNIFYVIKIKINVVCFHSMSIILAFGCFSCCLMAYKDSLLTSLWGKRSAFGRCLIFYCRIPVACFCCQAWWFSCTLKKITFKAFWVERIMSVYCEEEGKAKICRDYIISLGNWLWKVHWGTSIWEW